MRRLRDLLTASSSASYLLWRMLRASRPLRVQLRSGERITLRPPPANDIATAYEIWVMQQYAPRYPIDPCETVVDLGANVGFSMLYWAKRLEDAQVVGYEPHPVHAALAEELICRNGLSERVSVIRAAASVREGRGLLSDADTGSSLLADGVGPGIEVQLVDFFRAWSGRRIDLLKMDIEGSEYDLLGDDRFHELDIRNLVLEWHEKQAAAMGKAWCIERLKQMGFSVEDATPGRSEMGILWARKPASRRRVTGGPAAPRVSVVIPAYNCASRIGVPLAALAQQDADRESFEVLVIDSASSDDTHTAAEANPHTENLRKYGCTVRVVRETQPGLGRARQRGVAEARGEVICFVEDDTYPCSDFVRQGLAVFVDPTVGLVISQFKAWYMSPPPPSIKRREHLFGINAYNGDRFCDYGAGGTVVPSIGAGLWVRREAWKHAMRDADGGTPLRDRCGSSLATGGDIEIGYLVGRAGWRRVFAPALKLFHLIPDERLGVRYFCRLIVAIVRSELTLARRYDQLPPPPSRVAAVGSLLLAVVALPVLLSRKDGLREAAFVLADRWARALGPFSTNRISGRPTTRTRAEVPT